jgi:hypothetical protein
MTDSLEQKRHTDSPPDTAAGCLLSLVPLIVGFAAACILIPVLFGGKEVDFKNVTLPEGTVSIFASADGAPIHTQQIDELQQCLDGMSKRNAARRLLWIGNSQVHAINQYAQGQETAVPLLFGNVRKHDADLITFSYPNVNLQECYLVFEYLRSRASFDALILTAVYDDTRENGAGVDFARILEDQRTLALLGKTSCGGALLEAHRGTPDSTDDYAALKMTLQDRSERWLNDWLGDHAGMWRMRRQARGKLFLNLYYLKNFVFHINPQSKRPRIRGRYDANMAALDTMLQVAHDAGIRVLVYIAPLRNDVEIPYIRAEYEEFKTDVEKTATAEHAIFADLENLIPANLWGQKKSTSGGSDMELDFMHFQAAGHAILADELTRIVTTQLLK